MRLESGRRRVRHRTSLRAGLTGFVCALLALSCGQAHDADADAEDRLRERDARDGGAASAGAADPSDAGSAETNTPPSSPDAAVGVGPENPPPRPRDVFGFEPDPQGHVFAQDALRHYEVEVDPDEWAHINETAYLEQYIQGRLTIDGETYEQVGVRFKGFRGSLYNCFQFDDNGDAVGRTCSRLSLKLAFDEYDEEARFYDLKKLNFHAMRNDASMMRERLGYFLFREFGVPAPRAVHATLSVNGEDLGLFALVEEVDGRFTRARFPDGGEGNIYKERWPMSSADPDYFVSGLESNRSDPDLDVSKAVRFAEALMSATDDTIESVLREYTDFDALMRYLAVDRAIDHWDGPTAFRCRPEEDVPPLPPEVREAQTPPLGWETCQNKNFFWYEESVRDRFWMIAWDLDITFSSFSQFPDWNTEPLTCDIRQQGRPPRCDELVDWLATVLRPHYVRAGQELVAGVFRPEVLRGVVDGWYRQIAPVAGSTALDLGLLSLSSAIDRRYTEFQRDLAR